MYPIFTPSIDEGGLRRPIAGLAEDV